VEQRSSLVRAGLHRSDLGKHLQKPQHRSGRAGVQLAQHVEHPTPERTAFVRSRRELVRCGIVWALFEAETRQLEVKGVTVRSSPFGAAEMPASAQSIPAQSSRAASSDSGGAPFGSGRAMRSSCPIRCRAIARPPMMAAWNQSASRRLKPIRALVS
jgi:hypothetical protein